MSYTPNMQTTGTRHAAATAEAAKAHVRRRGAKLLPDVDQFIDTVWERAPKMGIRPEVAFGQALDETATFSSGYWVNHRNPGGLRITYPGEPSKTWATGKDAALGMLHRLSLYIHGSEHPAIADGRPHDPMPEAVGQAGYLGVAKRLQDLSGRWAANPNYANQIAAHLNAAFPGGDDASGPPQGEGPMNIPVAAPPLRISIMPFNNANRPKLTMSPEYITVHEVGNMKPGADEEMHRRFVHNGGGEAQVSFQFVVGPTEAIQLMPLDEAAWHASDGYNGTGNRKSIAIETIQIGNFDKTLWHLAWLINELATNPGRFYANVRKPEWNLSIDRIKQHNDWAPDNKNCPQFIRDRGLWGTLMQRVDAWNAAGEPQPEPEPEPKPEPIPEEKHQLPDGMTPQLASRLFGSYVAPWEGTPYVFDIDQAPSQVWLSRGKKSIPEGKTWAAGNWPTLNTVIRRGDGGQVWVWSDGSTYERNASKEAAA